MRAGDIVAHEPSGEEWVAARVTDDHIYPAGWPPCRADILDCSLVKACTDEEHQKMLDECSKLPRSDSRYQATQPSKER